MKEKVEQILGGGIPSWIITVIISVSASYFTLTKDVTALKTQVDSYTKTIEQLRTDKTDKELFIDYGRRLERLESKIDIIIQKR